MMSLTAHRSPLTAFFVLLILSSFAAQAQDTRRRDLDQLDRDSGGRCPNADPSDANDDTPAMMCALSLCADAPGVIHVPIGVYTISSAMTLPTGCSIEGDGDKSVLFQPAPIAGKPFLTMKSKTIVRGLTFDQTQPKPTADWKPLVYEPTVHMDSDDATIENVLFFRAFFAIRAAPVPQGSVGRILMRNIRAHSFAVGIEIDQAWDVVRVDQIHFWPFSDPGGPTEKWTRANGTAIRTLKNDNPFLTNIFAIHYRTAVELGDSCQDCVTSKAKIVNLDADMCTTGVWVKGPGTRGLLIENMSYQGQEGMTSIPILVTGAFSWLSVQHLDVQHASGPVVQIAATAGSSFVAVHEAMIRGYDRSGSGAAAFENLNLTSALYVRQSYLKRGWVINPCQAARICEVEFDNEL